MSNLNQAINSWIESLHTYIKGFPAEIVPLMRLENDMKKFLEAELAEARKMPEPMEFTKEIREFIQDKRKLLNTRAEPKWLSLCLSNLSLACDIVDDGPKKKPEPTEKTKKWRLELSNYLQQTKGDTPFAGRLLSACAEIDRLTTRVTELKNLLGEWEVYLDDQKKAIDRLSSELAKMNSWYCDQRTEIYRLQAELKAKDERIKHLQKRIDFVKVNP